LLSVSLLKHDQSSDIADRGKWVRDDAGVKLALEIKPERGNRLIPDLIRKHLAGEGTYGQIIEFGGLDFDSAKCKVELPDGTQRTFNIDAPENGHAMSQDIDPATRDDDDLDTDSLFSELRGVIEEM
jgi:hypothetical protein